MKKYIITVFLVIVSFSSLFAQDEDGKRYDKIQAIRVGFITERLHMSSEQSSHFWPIYDAYQKDRREARQTAIGKYLSTHPGATREKARAGLEGDLDLQSQELDLKKSYKDRLLQVISPKQLDELYQAERDFKVILLKQAAKGQ